jgi:hypothetical protein
MRPSARLAAAAFITALLGGCAVEPSPGPTAGPVNPGAAADADLFVVATADEFDVLVGIDVERRSLTRVAILRPNPKRPNLAGVMVSAPNQAVILTDQTSPDPLLWTSTFGDPVVRTIHRASGELLAFDAPGAGDGWMPFLADGALGWATESGLQEHRLVGVGGAFEINLPGEAAFVVAGPGADRITAVVEPPSQTGSCCDDHEVDVVVVDLTDQTVTELPIEPSYVGGIWADATMLAISDSGLSHQSILTWTVDASGSDPDAVAGLVEGPTLKTSGPEPALLSGGEGLIVASTGRWDRPIVEAIDLDSGAQRLMLELEESGSIMAMSVQGSTLVALEATNHDPQVLFIDLANGKVESVGLGGTTGTTWVVAP